ncbi:MULTISPECIES: hypothetical protein [Bacteria]|uniref:hypothetical protein n=1 Tax=Pseudomonadati TaxID=3379134 RepID=UPI0004868A96|nr:MULTISPECIES: hypothetical protein [Bacteria]
MTHDGHAAHVHRIELPGPQIDQDVVLLQRRLNSFGLADARRTQDEGGNAKGAKLPDDVGKTPDVHNVELLHGFTWDRGSDEKGMLSREI